MRYQTDLMQSILKNGTAQRMIDFVSPIYGNSYVALWLYQAIGTVIGETHDLAATLKYETNPETSTLLLGLWEDHYKIPRDSDLTVEQRRDRIKYKLRSQGPFNPSKLVSAISDSLGGVEVKIRENVSKNKFQVTILENVESIVPAIAVIEKMKPAHLIYDISIEIRTGQTANIKAAVAMTYAERYSLEVSSEIGGDEESDSTAVLGTAKLGTMILGHN